MPVQNKSGDLLKAPRNYKNLMHVIFIQSQEKWEEKV